MKAVFTLTPSESKRLIAKGVAAMDIVKKAQENAYLVLAGGTTNAFIAQELLGKEGIEPQRCSFGISTNGVLCNTPLDSLKMFPNVLYKGEPADKPLDQVFQDFHMDTVVIKGANAIDPEGNVGIVTSGFDGGTVPRVIGYVTSNGLNFITPVSLEKMVPSVLAGCKAVGAKKFDYSLGANFGMFHIADSIVVTEIEALDILFGVDATLVCAGGVGGNEGAVTLAVDGEEENIKKMIDLLENEIKGEPPVPGNVGVCETCVYKVCRFCGMKKEDLPEWIKR